MTMSGNEGEEYQQIAGVTFVVPIEAFRSDAVVAATAPSDIVDLYDAHTRIAAASSASREAGDASSADALQILANVAFYNLVPDDRGEPFRPVKIMGDRRSQIPSDLLAAQVEILALVSPNIGHPAIRARVNDICWFLNKTNAKAGLRAVNAYVACVDAVLTGQAKFGVNQHNPASVPACEFLRRATVIARSMGWTRAEFNPLRETIANVSKRTLDGDDAYGFSSIGPITYDSGIWEHKQIAAAAETLAASASISGDYPAQRALWELAARAHRKEKDTPNDQRCLIAAAETYAANAEGRWNSAMPQAACLNDAIQALRPIPGTVERRRQLQNRLNEVQPRILDEMSRFSHEQDITDIVEAAEKCVRGKPLADAIRACLICERSPDPEALQKEVLESSYGSIFATMPMTVYDSQGRTRFKAPGLLFDGSPDGDQVKFLVSQHDRFRRQYVVTGGINPIRRTLMAEHSLSIAALMPIMQASSFVPADHERVFAKGALRFFAGDDLEAAHLILPQLENSLRHILSISGVETNRINQDGTQEEAMLRRLLEEFREPLQKILPAATLQEIDLLFNFRGGPSVRHELAHGKMSDSDFWNSDVTYSIWFILHMAILPALEIWDDVAAEIARRVGR